MSMGSGMAQPMYCPKLLLAVIAGAAFLSSQLMFHPGVVFLVGCTMAAAKVA